MFIHEAVKKAQEQPSVIRRPVFGRAFILVPLNTKDCLYVGVEGSVDVAVGWEPSAEDLTAEDWEVIQVEGIEWPEQVPTPIQRVWEHFLRRKSG